MLRRARRAMRGPGRSGTPPSSGGGNQPRERCVRFAPIPEAVLGECGDQRLRPLLPLPGHRGQGQRRMAVEQLGEGQFPLGQVVLRRELQSLVQELARGGVLRGRVVESGQPVTGLAGKRIELQSVLEDRNRLGHAAEDGEEVSVARPGVDVTRAERHGALEVVSGPGPVPAEYRPGPTPGRESVRPGRVELHRKLCFRLRGLRQTLCFGEIPAPRVPVAQERLGQPGVRRGVAHIGGDRPPVLLDRVVQTVDRALALEL